MKTKFIMAAFALSISLWSHAQKNTKSEQFKVSGSCEMCKSRIEQIALDFHVHAAKWEKATQTLAITYDSTKTNGQKVRQALADAGHDNEEFRAPEKAYDKLPACCRYNRSGTPGDATTALSIMGVVLEESTKGKLSPLSNATIKNLKTHEQVISDSAGTFAMNGDTPTQIAVTYSGFNSDTIEVGEGQMISIVLKRSASGTLDEVIVTSRSRSSYVSSLSVLNKLNLTAGELTKAACCNLSESFETTPSVDVSYSDAVTGVKQIQLLGLSGNYTQLLTENVPEIKGLAAHYGMTYVPGPWLEGIQLTKGVGSVVNGYESIAGQINLEEKKPDNSESLFINAYANTMGRLEANINTAHKLNNKWTVGLLAHGNYSDRKVDMNSDGFLDIPTGSQWNLINRWKYLDNNGWIIQFALKAMNDQRYAGQMNFDRTTDRNTTNAYGVGVHGQQYSFTSKIGYIFPQHKYKSLGLILSAGRYTNDAYYGLSDYNGKQHTIYGNLIYQSIIGNTNHKFKTGFSFANENYDEKFNTQVFKRNEIIPGSFFEYTYTPDEKLTLLAGIRADFHNLYGVITTPRAHIKYDFTPKTNLRLSGGSGFRVNNIFAENVGVFVSSRNYEILAPSSSYGYGLNPEKAWNYGLNFTHNFRLNNRSGAFAFDMYRTSFQNQTVADMDADAQTISFYNLNGKSFANSIQAEVNYELFKNFDARMAYRWLDVKTTYKTGLMEKPFVARHRAFINLQYETPNEWTFDYTTQWLSKKRIPATGGNPVDLQMPAYSPAYIQMAAQVSKKLGNKWDVYVGGENLTNFVQEHRIIDAQNPFGPYFDGSLTWGPVVGRMIYVGMRWRLSGE
ncbi:TonB-dependent receptor domain-containing protein [Niabella insulamsoli]|uniref:TonB-dependent receptor domain-containing protein n=1 Tax=Niabella insulamsoli TaxID=3144874 RepID=UPI0031FDDC06